MATVSVYRIQHREDGSGPYFGEHAVGSALEYSRDRHPEPQDDGIDWKAIRKNRLCGFSDEQSMASWFSAEDAAFLHTVGFAVAVYALEESKIAHGNRQVLFPESAELQELRPIPELDCWNLDLPTSDPASSIQP